jgi:hypothetical protein
VTELSDEKVRYLAEVFQTVEVAGMQTAPVRNILEA